MSAPSRPSLLNGCPRCRRGRIIEGGFMRMNKSCPECGLLFERESGQHLGAAALAYALGAAIGLPLFFVLLMNRATPLQAVGVPTLVLAALSPINVRLSRQLWAHFLFMIQR